MKILTILVPVAAIAILGCSSSDQANAGAQDTAAKQPAQAAAKATVPHNQSHMAPSWDLYDIQGNHISSDAFAGKIQIIDFWATWCGPCKIEIPHFIELQEEYQGDLAVIGVALDQLARVAPFSKKFNITYTNLIGNQKVARDFGFTGSLPTTYVIAQDGSIYRRYVGLRPKSTFDADIRALLEKAEK